MSYPNFGGGAGGFVQNGNSFGALAVLGTNDAFDLAIETSAIEAARFTAGGFFGVGVIAPDTIVHAQRDGASNHVLFTAESLNVANAGLRLKNLSREWDLITNLSGNVQLLTSGSQAFVVSGSPLNFGIGPNLTTPVAALQVHSQTSNARVLLTNATTGQAASDGAFLSVDIASSNFRVVNQEAANLAIETNGAVHITLNSAGSTSFNRAVSYPILSTSADLTLDTTHFTVLVDATGANRTINLPAAAGATGRVYTIKKISTLNLVTIDPNGGETIDGQATLVLTTLNDFTQIQSDGSNWFVIG